MHDQTYGTGLERDHPFRDIGLATKQAQNVAERMEMITAATKTAQNVANTKITTIINVSFPQIVVCLAETASIQRAILPLGFPSRFPPPYFLSNPLHWLLCCDEMSLPALTNAPQSTFSSPLTSTQTEVRRWNSA